MVRWLEGEREEDEGKRKRKRNKKRTSQDFITSTFVNDGRFAFHTSESRVMNQLSALDASRRSTMLRAMSRREMVPLSSALARADGESRLDSPPFSPSPSNPSDPSDSGSDSDPDAEGFLVRWRISDIVSLKFL